MDPAFKVTPFFGAKAVVAQPDGKIIVGGSFTRIGETERDSLARFNADGTLDLTFRADASGGGSRFQSTTVNVLVRQPDGKVLVGGRFDQLQGVDRRDLARLNPDGSLDLTFDAHLMGGFPDFNGALHGADSLALLPDGKILVGGEFSRPDGTTRSVTRLNADGRLDDGFDPDIGFDGKTRPYVYAIAPQADGKLLVGGIFRGVNGVARNNLARFNADGSLDADFRTDPRSGRQGSLGQINAILVQADGGIVLGGEFAAVNGVARSGIARLTADGEVDQGFVATVDQDRTVYSLAMQPSGQILVGGTFFQINGKACNSLARLNVDGSPDYSFRSTGSTNGFLSVMVLPDGHLLVGGSITQINGVTIHDVVRLNGAPPPALPSFFNGSAYVFGGFSYLPSFGYYSLSPEPGYVFHNDLGFLYFIDANDGKGGVYFYDFATTAGGQSSGFLYTSPNLFPYLYSFGLKTFVYYFPDSSRGSGFYTTAPRVFSRLDTGEVIFR